MSDHTIKQPLFPPGNVGVWIFLLLSTIALVLLGGVVWLAREALVEAPLLPTPAVVEPTAIAEATRGEATPTATLPATSTPAAVATDTAVPTPTLVGSIVDTPGPTATAAACRYSMAFVADVTIPDDTVIPPGVAFVKTWRVRNDGDCPWAPNSAWVFSGGSQLSGASAIGVPATAPGETADISVHLVAPTTPGSYTGYWRLRSPEGTLSAQQVFVRIIVPAPSATPAPPTVTPAATVPPTATALPTATATPVITNWRGEYYRNLTLAGDPVLVRDDAAVNFNWGSGSPASGLPADGFSARWNRTQYFDAGTYRFYARSDDGVRVWLDSTLIIDQWHDASGATYQTDRVLTAGNHALRVEYYENLGTAQIQLWWERPASYTDWKGEYWANKNLSGQPAVVRNDRTLDFNWGSDAPASGLPADGFSARWTRTISFAEDNYRFHIIVDDGARLYVDDQLVINQWHDGERREVTVDRWLSSGNHTLRVEFYENAGNALVSFWWETLSGYPEWRGEYWANKSLSGAPTLVRNDREINFDWGFNAPASGLPDENFSVRWTRQMAFSPGLYRLSALADDGVRVYVDGRLLIDHWVDGSADRPLHGEVALNGTHTIIVEYYENNFGAEIKFWYERLD